MDVQSIPQKLQFVCNFWVRKDSKAGGQLVGKNLDLTRRLRKTSHSQSNEGAALGSNVTPEGKTCCLTPVNRTKSSLAAPISFW